MSALDDLKVLDTRLQAVAAATPNDTATAVANAVAPLNEQITALNAAAATAESDLAAEVTALTPTVVALETAVGITFTPPAPEPTV